MKGPINRIAAKNAELNKLRRRAPAGLGDFDRMQDLELTYTSNALAGNGLTAEETTLVIEQGITAGGKRLTDHLEAVDHIHALGFARELARESRPLTDAEVRILHRLLMQRSSPENAGLYTDQSGNPMVDAARQATASPTGATALMGDFAIWLSRAAPTLAMAFAAHRRLAEIHPFTDGNGRTARLLMNVILLRGGFPPIAIRPEDRAAYFDALQQARAGHGSDSFDHLLYERLDATLDKYLSTARQAPPEASARSRGSDRS